MLKIKLIFFWILLLATTLNVSLWAQGPQVVSSNPTDKETEVPVAYMGDIEISYNTSLFADNTGTAITDNNVGQFVEVLKVVTTIPLTFDTLSNTEYTVKIKNGRKIVITPNDWLLTSQTYVIANKPMYNSTGIVNNGYNFNFSTGAGAIVVFPQKRDICIGSNFFTVGQITIKEGGRRNFRYVPNAGGRYIINLKLPDGFEFSTANIGNIWIRLADRNRADITNDLKKRFLDSRTFQISFPNSAAMRGNYSDEIRISRLKVKATGKFLDPNTTYELTASSLPDDLPGIGVGSTPFATFKVKEYPAVTITANGSDANTFIGCSGETIRFDGSSIQGAKIGFYLNGKLNSSGNPYYENDLTDGDEIYARAEKNGCVAESNRITISLKPSVDLVFDYDDGSTKLPIKANDVFPIGDDAIPAKLLIETGFKDLVGEYAGPGITKRDNTTYLFNPETLSPGNYDIQFIPDGGNNTCATLTQFTINVFENNTQHLLGITNSGLCTDDPRDETRIGWNGQSTVGFLIGSSDAITCTNFASAIGGTLDPDYNRGLSSGFHFSLSNIRTAIVNDQLKADDTLDIEINYVKEKGTVTPLQKLNQRVFLAQVPGIGIDVLGNDSLRSDYCHFDSFIELAGIPLENPGGTKVFSILDLDRSGVKDSAKLLNRLEVFFDPNEASLQNIPENYLKPNTNGYAVFYEYISEYGCFAEKTDTVYVRSLPTPVIDEMVVINHCIDDDIAPYIPPMSIQGVDTVAIRDSLDFAWYDERGNFLSTGYTYQPQINDEAPSENEFGLRAVSKLYGCKSEETQVMVNVGEVPKANFSFKESCAVGTISFEEQAMEGLALKDTVNYYRWDFGDPLQTPGPEISLSPNPFYAFSLPGVYDVELLVSTSVGCQDSITIKVNSLGESPVDPLKKVYFEDFESGKNGWVSSVDMDQGNGMGSNGSWDWKIPNGEVINMMDTGNKAWVTSDPETNRYNDNENSWVEGPCINLNLFKNPKLELDIWCETQQLEGATLQYAVKGTFTTPENTKWIRVGDIGEGINWFNSAGVSSSPGGSTIGWQGSSNKWKNSKINLDEIQAAAMGQPVRFRLAFASLELNDSRQLDGFAFDNFTVKERNRFTLLEHFIEAKQDATPADQNQLDKIQAFMTNANKEATFITYIEKLSRDFGAQRSQNGGVSTYLNGINAPKAFEKNFSAQRLEASKIVMNILQETIEDTLNININLTNIGQNAIKNTTILEIALVKDEIVHNGQTYQNVVHEMLPSAAGTYLAIAERQEVWEAGTTKNIRFQWKPRKPMEGEWHIVAWVYQPIPSMENSTSGKILQTTLSNQITPLPTPGRIVGIDLPELATENFTIYPNPTQGITNIAFGSIIKKPVILLVYNTTGQLVIKQDIPTGTTSHKIDFSKLTNGVYNLMIGNQTTKISIRK